MSEPIHYPPHCTIKNCSKCKINSEEVASRPKTRVEGNPICGCLFETKGDGVWTCITKGNACTEEFHRIT